MKTLKQQAAAKALANKKRKKEDGLYTDQMLNLNKQINDTKEGSDEEKKMLRRKNRIEKAHKRAKVSNE
jgi:hypothetical protein